MTSARVGVDVGGTFTDIVLLVEDQLITLKVPSTPEDQSIGFASGLAELLDGSGRPEVEVIAHGTTVATNAVLERKGARTALLTTDGFRDVLVIGRQQRPSLYDLFADRPEPVVARALSYGVPERIDRDGSVLHELEEEAARAVIERALAAGAESFAVCLLFSFVNPAHEHRIRALVPDGVRVSLSSEVLPEFREYERASTTALDAYVGPVVERYVANIRARVGVPVVVMRSGGGTMSAEQAAREPVHTLLSGPAGGVRGATLVARAAGIDDIVTFDMGGTSTDVCLVEGGEPAIATESSIGGLPFRTPALAVHTVGAGGGSILWVDEAGALRAGPRSAGAVPGPASYARGGVEPTVTDAHVVLGHIDPEAFLGGRMRLDAEAAWDALARLGKELGVAIEEVARAGLAAARAAMAAAIRVVTVERGRDPRDFALVAFGGAGPMHACALAGELGMTRVLIPPVAGVLSALGLLAAPLTADASRTQLMVSPPGDEMERTLEPLIAEVERGVRAQGAEPARVVCSLDCRYAGQAHEVTVEATPIDGLFERFASEHRARFGWDAPGEPIEVVTFRARALGPEPAVELPSIARAERIEGPRIIARDDSTVLIEDGWTGEMIETGAILLWMR